MLAIGKILNILREEDATTLATCFWLADDHSTFLLQKSFQLGVLGREGPCSGMEIILFWVLLVHFCYIPGKIVLAAELEHTWEVVDFLVIFHPGQ